MNALEYLIDITISAAFALWPHPRPKSDALQKAKIVAHRGVHEDRLAVENSRAAFQLALDHGVWAVELDVRFSKDHVAVISHDPDCGRIHKRKDIVIELTDWAKIHEQVPEILTLDTVVRDFGRKLHLMIEIKEDLNKSPENTAAFKASLQNLRPEMDYHVLSLSPEYLIPLTFLPSSSLMDVLWLDKKRIFQLNETLGHGAMAGHFLFFDSEKISELHRRGRKVGVGFIRSRNSLYRELNRGVDFIFTNHPLHLQKLLQKTGK